jgi:hypothetical protein
MEKISLGINDGSRRDAFRALRYFFPYYIFFFKCTNACLKVLYYAYEWRCQEQHGREMDAVDKRGSRVSPSDMFFFVIRYYYTNTSEYLKIKIAPQMESTGNRSRRQGLETGVSRAPGVFFFAIRY